MAFTLPETGKSIFRGDTIVIEAAISQSGTPTNLTGYSVWFTAKVNISHTDDNAATIQKTLVSGITMVDIAKGLIRITLAPADTAQISSDTTYFCDIQVKNGAGEVSTVDKGTMTVQVDVTNAV